MVTNPEGLANSNFQFQTAGGRPVIAGSGITPDIWVENEENILPDALRALLFSEMRPFYMYGERFLRANPQIKRLGDQFVTRFVVTDQMILEFCEFVKGIDRSAAHIDFTGYREQVKFLLKREMAYLVGGETERFQVNMIKDRQLQIAMAQLEQAQKLLSATNFVQ